MEIHALKRRPAPLIWAERNRVIEIGGWFYCKHTEHLIADSQQNPYAGSHAAKGRPGRANGTTGRAARLRVRTKGARELHALGR